VPWTGRTPHADRRARSTRPGSVDVSPRRSNVLPSMFLASVAAGGGLPRLPRRPAFARFGHNHVVVGACTARSTAGDTAAASGLRLRNSVAFLRRGSARPRRRRGRRRICGAGSRSPRAANTRENMLGRDVLDAEKHPLSGSSRSPLVRSAVGSDGHGHAVHAPWSERATCAFAAAVVRQDGMLVVIRGFPHQPVGVSASSLSLLSTGFAGARCARYPRPSRRAAANYVLLHFPL